MSKRIKLQTFTDPQVDATVQRFTHNGRIDQLVEFLGVGVFTDAYMYNFRVELEKLVADVVLVTRGDRQK